MSDTLTLSAETRDRAGKGASRALRREGRVPAVIYGNKQDPASIHVNERELQKLLNTGHFFNSVIMVNGERTLAKEMEAAKGATSAGEGFFLDERKKFKR